MDDFKEARDFLRSVLIVALSEEIGSDENEISLQSQIHLTRMNNIIKDMTINEQEKIENVCDDYDKYDENVVGSWTLWAENIFTEAQQIANDSNNGSILNAYYNIEVAKKIKQLMHYLPLWTNIMRPYFKHGEQICTSSFVEAEFAQLKNGFFKKQLPMRADKFILRHLSYLDSKFKLTYGASKEESVDATNSMRQNKNVPKSDTSDLQDPAEPVKYEIDIETSLNETENWRNKIKKSAKDKKPNYLTPCPDWDSANKTIGIPLLKNGSLCNATLIKSKEILVHETCAFDSIFQVIASGIGIYED